MFSGEIVLRFFKHLPARDLTQAAQVCKNWNNLSNDERLWKRLLKKDFYFTHETLERLKEKRQQNYKELYQYCDQYELSIHQKAALNGLTKYSLTREHLSGRDWFANVIYKDALIYLINKNGITPLEALAELDHLNQEQVFALSRLYSKGLRSADFWKHVSVLVCNYQIECLMYLALERSARLGGPFEIDTAIDILKFMFFQVSMSSPFEVRIALSNWESCVESYVNAFESNKIGISHK